jgi:hypothetical protein
MSWINAGPEKKIETGIKETGHLTTNTTTTSQIQKKCPALSAFVLLATA